MLSGSVASFQACLNATFFFIYLLWLRLSQIGLFLLIFTAIWPKSQFIGRAWILPVKRKGAFPPSVTRHFSLNDKEVELFISSIYPVKGSAECAYFSSFSLLLVFNSEWQQVMDVLEADMINVMTPITVNSSESNSSITLAQRIDTCCILYLDDFCLMTRSVWYTCQWSNASQW